MTSSCSVVCSNKSSLPEVVGHSALFKDLNDNRTASLHIELVLDLSPKNQISAKGIKQASKFTWEKTAKERICFYNNLMDKK